MRHIAAPRLRLAHLPTPLEEAPRLAAAIGASGRVFLKRDDCTGLGLGGNKTRKLEFTLGEARRLGCDTLITTGGLQSNHVRQTAAAAAKLGFACHAVVSNPLRVSPPAYGRSGNLLLDRLFGAVVHVVDDDETVIARTVEALAVQVEADGGKPYVVPLGASDGIGSLGYVDCAWELLDQCAAQGVKPGHIVVCTGSSGTHAGLLTGLRLAGCPVEVLGVSSSEPAVVKQGKVRAISRAVLATLGEAEWPGLDEDVIVTDAYVGAGYGYQTEAAEAAIRTAAASEGVLLDPVYTAKAMAFLIDRFGNGGAADGDVIFMHTGGTPALFAYA